MFNSDMLILKMLKDKLKDQFLNIKGSNAYNTGGIESVILNIGKSKTIKHIKKMYAPSFTNKSCKVK